MKFLSLIKLKKTEPFTSEILNKRYLKLFCENLKSYKKDLPYTDRMKFEKIISQQTACFEKLKISCSNASFDSIATFFIFNHFKFDFHPIEILGVILQIKKENFLEVHAFYHDKKYIFINSSDTIKEIELKDNLFYVVSEPIFNVCLNELNGKPKWEGLSALEPENESLRITILTTQGKYGCVGPVKAFESESFGKRILSSISLSKKLVLKY